MSHKAFDVECTNEKKKKKNLEIREADKRAREREREREVHTVIPQRRTHAAASKRDFRAFTIRTCCCYWCCATSAACSSGFASVSLNDGNPHAGTLYTSLIKIATRSNNKSTITKRISREERQNRRKLC